MNDRERKGEGGSEKKRGRERGGEGKCQKHKTDTGRETKNTRETEDTKHKSGGEV